MSDGSGSRHSWGSGIIDKFTISPFLLDTAQGAAHGLAIGNLYGLKKNQKNENGYSKTSTR